MGDADFFEADDAANRISLQELANSEFALTTPDGSGITAALTELKFSLKQKHGPRLYVCSKDVFETLELNGLRRKLDGDRIAKAVFKITFPDDQRGKRVEISAPNRIKFKRATHAEDVFQLLEDWGLLVDEDDEDAAELRAASVAFARSSDSVTVGASKVSAAGKKGAQTKPRAK